MSDAGGSTASFESTSSARARVVGPLDFATVVGLLPQGTAAIEAGAATQESVGIHGDAAVEGGAVTAASRALAIDLGGVTGGDSAGLALLIEWLSAARAAQCDLRYENIPVQLRQLARLSDVEELLIAA